MIYSKKSLGNLRVLGLDVDNASSITSDKFCDIENFIVANDMIQLSVDSSWIYQFSNHFFIGKEIIGQVTSSEWKTIDFEAQEVWNFPLNQTSNDTELNWFNLKMGDLISAKTYHLEKCSKLEELGQNICRFEIKTIDDGDALRLQLGLDIFDLSQ